MNWILVCKPSKGNRQGFNPQQSLGGSDFNCISECILGPSDEYPFLSMKYDKICSHQEYFNLILQQWGSSLFPVSYERSSFHVSNFFQAVGVITNFWRSNSQVFCPQCENVSNYNLRNEEIFIFRFTWFYQCKDYTSWSYGGIASDPVPRYQVQVPT